MTNKNGEITMKLVFPTLAYKEKAIEFINEFFEYGSEVDGSGSLVNFLRDGKSYESWLEKVIASIDVANVDYPNRVPAITYFYVREEDDRIVGMMNMRLCENDFIRAEAGHIGYCIRPTERRKHYATQMLAEGVRVCKLMRINNVIVSCDKVNIASAKTIMNNGGVLDAEFFSERFGEVIQRYVIKV